MIERQDEILFRVVFTLLIVCAIAIFELVGVKAYDRFFSESYVLPKTEWVCSEVAKVDGNAGAIPMRDAHTICVTYKKL